MADPALQAIKPLDAKKLARIVVEDGDVEFSGHALTEMDNDDLATTDCLNIVRAGVWHPAENINGQWRYRVTTLTMCVVVTFKSQSRLRVVTAWRI